MVESAPTGAQTSLLHRQSRRKSFDFQSPFPLKPAQSTGGTGPVTAEVAGSSPVTPATIPASFRRSPKNESALTGALMGHLGQKRGENATRAI